MASEPEQEGGPDEPVSTPLLLVGALSRPLSTLSRAAHEQRLAAGILGVVIAGLTWAAFSLVLALRGHEPSFTGNPIQPESYYAAQAAFVAPLLLTGWAALSFTAHAVGRFLGGTGALSGTAAALGLAYGPPILVLFLVPDLLVYVAGGFVELGFLVRLSAPLTGLWVLLMSTVAVRVSHELPWIRAFTAAFVGWLVQAALVGAWIR